MSLYYYGLQRKVWPGFLPWLKERDMKSKSYWTPVSCVVYQVAQEELGHAGKGEKPVYQGDRRTGEKALGACKYLVLVFPDMLPHTYTCAWCKTSSSS